MKVRKRLRRETTVIALVFLAIILTGTLLLLLPVSARDGRSCGTAHRALYSHLRHLRHRSCHP